LRLYGARGLKPVDLGNGATKSVSELTGIADPQSQGGGAAVSTVKVSAVQTGSDGGVALSPTPAPGFSGAAAIDADGKLAGIAVSRPVLVAGPANATPSAQALLAPTATLREFLRANGVSPSGVSPDANAPDAKAPDAKAPDAKAAVVRVICVRK
jgi:hypothetical protein